MGHLCNHLALWTDGQPGTADEDIWMGQGFVVDLKWWTYKHQSFIPHGVHYLLGNAWILLSFQNYSINCLSALDKKNPVAVTIIHWIDSENIKNKKTTAHSDTVLHTCQKHADVLPMQINNKTMHSNMKIKRQVNTPLQRKLRLHLNIGCRRIFRRPFLDSNTYDYSCTSYKTNISRHLQLLTWIITRNGLKVSLVCNTNRPQKMKRW